MTLTKVQAIKEVMKNNGGKATLAEIYRDVKKYKDDVDTSVVWKAGLRGVLYREVRQNRTFKKAHPATYELI